MKQFASYDESPIGLLKIITTNTHVISIDCCNQYEECSSNDLSEKAVLELTEYFTGTRSSFDLPLELIGTSFQQKVWKKISEIPYGTTWSYQQVTEEIGNKNGVRAVANSISKNPLLIVVPCHRVIGKNGTLTGFRVGIDKKEYLLQLEKVDKLDKST